MENQFNLSLNDISLMMSVELEVHRSAGLAADEATIKSFRQRLKAKIKAFKNAALDLEHKLAGTNTYAAQMLAQMNELLRIMNAPHPEFAIEGWYSSPDKPSDPLYFYSYHDLYELVLWIIASTRKTDLPLHFQAMVRQHYEELKTLRQALLEKGMNEFLVNALMSAFDKVREEDPVDLTFHELTVLRKVRKMIDDCCCQAPEKMGAALHQVLLVMNVNTLESLIYCKAHVSTLVDSAATPADKVNVLDLQELVLRQATVVSDVSFQPFRETLRDEVLTHIKYLRKYWSKRNDEPVIHKGTAATNGAPPLQTSINMPNQHFGARLRVEHACGRYKSSKNALIKASCSFFLSNKDTALGEQAFETYVDRPTGPAAKAAFRMNLEELGWMSKHWKAYDIPDVFTMPDRDLKKLFLSMESSIPNQ